MEGRLLAQQQELHSAHAEVSALRQRMAAAPPPEALRAAEQAMAEQREELETLRATIVMAHETCQTLAQAKACHPSIGRFRAIGWNHRGCSRRRSRGTSQRFGSSRRQRQRCAASWRPFVQLKVVQTNPFNLLTCGI